MILECYPMLPRPPELVPGSPDRDWMTPLGFAIVNGRAEAVQLLLKQGADRSVRDGAGRSYFDLAREAESQDILALLRAT